MPGAMSIAEVVAGMEAGADIIKVFPGELFGPKILKSIHGPIPQAELMPTGGVSLDNVAEWIAAGAVAVGAGGSLTAGAKTGDYGKTCIRDRAYSTWGFPPPRWTRPPLFMSPLALSGPTALSIPARGSGCAFSPAAACASKPTRDVYKRQDRYPV